ncbi:MAG TPA: mannose-1-phosphate guanylyltransferase [Candidatus Kryptonia bacterium]
MRVFGVIMAGGVGSRLWPQSRQGRPKQFQVLFGDRTLYQRTFDRLTRIVSPDNIFVVTNKAQEANAAEQLPNLPKKNLIVEPVGRSTAPCIALAACAISSVTEDAVMMVFPADHLISGEDNFVAQLKDAVRLAQKRRALVTIGIRPTYPETGFGYIHYDENRDEELYLHGGHSVIAFKEKPDHDTAVKFLSEGNYLWNSGMFVWRVDVILEELRKNLEGFSEFFEPLRRSFGGPEFGKQIENFYAKISSISIDYAVMEKAEGVLTLPGKFGWSDVGSWDEVYKLSNKDEDGNSLHGPILKIGSSNNLVWAQEKTFVLADIKDLIIIETKDSVLICKRGSSQSVKEIVEILRKQDRQDLI